MNPLIDVHQSGDPHPLDYQEWDRRLDNYFSLILLIGCRVSMAVELATERMMRCCRGWQRAPGHAIAANPSPAQGRLASSTSMAGISVPTHAIAWGGGIPAGLLGEGVNTAATPQLKQVCGRHQSGGEARGIVARLWA